MPAHLATELPDIVARIQGHVEACRYHQALQTIWLEILNPTNKHVEDTQPWKLFKTDPEAAKRVMYDLAEVLRVVAILLKPFLPRAADTIYAAFNFPTAWEKVSYEDAATWPERSQDLTLDPGLRSGVKQLFPRIVVKKS